MEQLILSCILEHIRYRTWGVQWVAFATYAQMPMTTYRPDSLTLGKIACMDQFGFVQGNRLLQLGETYPTRQTPRMHCNTAQRLAGGI